MKSTGPPRTRKSRAPELETFAQEIRAANGEWVEIEMLRPGYSQDLETTYSRLGRIVAELTQNNGTLYGRMKSN